MRHTYESTRNGRRLEPELIGLQSEKTYAGGLKTLRSAETLLHSPLSGSGMPTRADRDEPAHDADWLLGFAASSGALRVLAAAVQAKS